MYDKILHQAKMRRDRQRRTVTETAAYLEAVQAVPGVSEKTITAVKAKLARQKEALRVTEDELHTAHILAGDPAQKDIESEISENEKAAASKLGRRR